MVSRKPYRVSLPGGRVLELGRRTLVMGILNVTPDSFSDGGCFLDPAAAVAAAERLEAQGADIIDIGGESTRPGAAPVDADEERRRVIPVIEAVAGRIGALVSVDTTKADVARAAIAAGAVIVNDISGLRYDPHLGRTVADAGCGLVLMHMRGQPSNMYGEASYVDVAGEVAGELAESIATAERAGVDRRQIIVDPGLGFAKRAAHSYEMLASLDVLAALDRPVLVGPSRKSFLQAGTRQAAPGERDWMTAGAVAAAIFAGAHVVRVHAVAQLVDVVRVVDAVIAAREVRRIER